MAINQYNEACAEYNRQLNAYNAALQQYQNAERGSTKARRRIGAMRTISHRHPNR